MRLTTKLIMGLVFIFCLVLTLNLLSSHASATTATKGSEGYESYAVGAPPNTALWYTITSWHALVSNTHVHSGSKALSGDNNPASFVSMTPNSYYDNLSFWYFYFYMSSASDFEVYENANLHETIHLLFYSNQTVWYYDGSSLKNLSYNFNLNEWYTIQFSSIDWIGHTYDIAVGNANSSYVKTKSNVDFEHDNNSFRGMIYLYLEKVWIDDITTDAPAYMSSFSPWDNNVTGTPIITAVVDDYDNTVIVTGEHIELQYRQSGLGLPWTTSPITYTGAFPKTCTWDLTGLIFFGHWYDWRLSYTYDYGYMPYNDTYGSFYQFGLTDLFPPTVTLIYPTAGSTTSAVTWKNNHDIIISVYDPDTYYDVGFEIETIWSTYYMYTTGHPTTSPYYNASLHHQIGYCNITLPGEQWIPFFDHYHLYYFVWETYGTNLSGMGYSFTIDGSKHFTDTVSIRGFLPVNGNMMQYNRVGQSVWYWMMNNRTDNQPSAHLFLTDDTGKIIKQYHSDNTNWNKLPYLEWTKYYAFELFTQWASQLKINHAYNFYIGFSQSAGWDSSSLDIQLLYDSGVILNFGGNNPWARGYPDKIIDDDSEAFDYWGVKISFGTYTSQSSMTGTGTSEGDQTGGTWGSNLGAQIDSATGISGTGIVIGLIVLALFSFLPIIILKHVPTLEIMILFADFGAVFAFAIGLFPLWIFFLVVIVVVLFLIYRVRSWIMQGTQMQDVVDNQGTVGGGIGKATKGLGKRISKGVKRLTK